MRHVVILAGGGGTRFWPLSTPERPKQFLRLFGRRTLLGDTVARCRGLVPRSRTWVVTSEAHAALTRHELPTIPARQILGEPVGRNSGAAIALAARVIGATDPGATLLFLPADAHIPDPVAFRNSARAALEAAEAPKSFVTLGLRPTYPATGYGYLLPAPGPSLRPRPPLPLASFVEKPPVAKARRLIRAGALWNAGIFAGRARAFTAAFGEFMPAIARGLSGAAEAWGRGAASFARFLRAACPKLPSISIDYAVMEPASRSSRWRLLTVPGNFAWSDVGTWRALRDLMPLDERGNVIEGRHDGTCHNCLVHSRRPWGISTSDLRDLAVVSTPHATLVARLAEAERVREIPAALAAGRAIPAGDGRCVSIDSPNCRVRVPRSHAVGLIGVRGVEVFPTRDGICILGRR